METLSGGGINSLEYTFRAGVFCGLALMENYLSVPVMCIHFLT